MSLKYPSYIIKQAHYTYIRLIRQKEGSMLRFLNFAHQRSIHVMAWKVYFIYMKRKPKKSTRFTITVEFQGFQFSLFLIKIFHIHTRNSVLYYFLYLNQFHYCLKKNLSFRITDMNSKFFN